MITVKDEQATVAEWLKKLTSAVESGKVVVRSVTTPIVQESGWRMVEYRWSPQIEFLVISPETADLFTSLGAP